VGAAVELEGVSKRFGRVEALREASFEVQEGSVTGLLGPNGAGKTTTLKILVGLLRPDAGAVRVLGVDPWAEGHRVRQRVGILHERPIYPADVDVWRLLRYAARVRGLHPTDAHRAARLAGLMGHLDRRVSALSRGYLQRLGVALAIMGDPELLLLDEPTANLDPAARMEILDLIATLKTELGVTMLISSHIIPELELVCDSAAFISEGRILDYGPLEDLARRHGTEARVVLRASRPREVAARLISLESVEAVEVRGQRVTVRVAPGSLSLAQAEISALPGVEVLSSGRAGLMDLYRRVVLREAS